MPNIFIGSTALSVDMIDKFILVSLIDSNIEIVAIILFLTAEIMFSSRKLTCLYAAA